MAKAFSPVVCGQIPTPGSADLFVFGEDLAFEGANPHASHPIADGVKGLFLALTRGRDVDNLESHTATPDGQAGVAGNLVFGNIVGQMTVQGLATIRANPGLAISGSNVMEVLAGFSGQTPNAFTLSFSRPVVGWGFYGIDFGSSQERNVFVEYLRDDGTQDSVTIPHYVNTGPSDPLPGRAVLFFGLIAAASPIKAVTVAQARGSGDRLFFDQIIVARRLAVQLSVP